MRKTLFIVLFAWLAAVPGYAQTVNDWHVAAGISFMNASPGAEDGGTASGWLVGGGARVTPLIDVVGEVGGNYKSFEENVIDSTLSLVSVLAGPRIASRGSATFTPFGQLLIGMHRRSLDIEGVSTSATDFALQPGAGVDWFFQPNLGLRAGADYRRVFADDEGLDHWRFHVGIVYKGGGQ